MSASLSESSAPNKPRESFVYWHPFIYKFAMRLLYLFNYRDRYKAVADLIPDHCSVMELCAGDGELFHKHLRMKAGIRYMGYDRNRGFVTSCLKKNIPMTEFDITIDPIETRADFVILQASLYQFMPDHEYIIKKMLAQTDRLCIIAEPIRNLKDSKIKLVSKLASWADRSSEAAMKKGFDEASADHFFKDRFGLNLQHSMVCAGGQEKIFVLNPRPKSK